MKKKKHFVKKQDNVLLFPGVEHRLREEGLQALENKQFSRAIDLLQQSLHIDDSRQEVYLGLVVSYFEMGNFKEAKKLANEMLKEDIGDYFQIIELYITILVQLHEYSEIVTTLEALLEEEKESIPPERLDHFEHMLDFSRRMAVGEQRKPIEQFEPEYTNIEASFTLNGLTQQEQLIQIAGLATQNIRPHINEIKQFLMEEKEHPFLKTMLLLALKEQDVQENVVVNKLGRQLQCQPNKLVEVHNHDFFNKTIAILDERLSQNDPVLFENIRMMIERHFYLLYPFLVQPELETLWASAYHYTGLKFFGSTISLEKIATQYEVNQQQLTAAIEEIQQLEEISSPIM